MGKRVYFGNLREIATKFNADGSLPDEFFLFQELAKAGFANMAGGFIKYKSKVFFVLLDGDEFGILPVKNRKIIRDCLIQPDIDPDEEIELISLTEICNLRQNNQGEEMPKLTILGQVEAGGFFPWQGLGMIFVKPLSEGGSFHLVNTDGTTSKKIAGIGIPENAAVHVYTKKECNSAGIQIDKNGGPIWAD